MIGLLLTLALAEEPSPEPVEESTPTERVVLRRRLPPSAVDSAFLTTHLAFRQGGGLLAYPDYEVEDLGTFDLRLVGATESLEFQARLRPWLAVGASLSGSVVSGVNLDSVFVSGADSGIGGQLWGRVGLIQTERAVVSARVLLSGERGASLTPSSLADAFATDRWDTLSAVLKGQILDYVLGQRRSTTGGVGLSAARDLGRQVGLQGSLTWRAGSVAYLPFGRRAKATRTSRQAIGGGVALDWTPEGRIPLGGMVEVFSRQESQGLLVGDGRASSTNRLLTAFTLAYTGREDLHLGLNLGALFPTLKPAREQLATADLTFRYDF